MDISVVVPLYNEEESLPELAAWINRVMEANHFTYEIIMVDDGSNDSSWKVIEKLSAKDNRIRGIKFRRNYGKSAALQIRGCPMPGGHYHVRRLAGQPGRDTRTLPDGYGRRLRPRVRVETKEI